MKNKKAISPVLAVLLMIAVAVAAALITYAWVMTYLSSTTSRAGHAIQIQSVDFTGALASTVYAQNVGDGTITITSVYIDGATAASGGLGGLGEGLTAALTVTLPAAVANGDDVLIKVVCDDGTFTEGTYTVEGL